MTIPQSVASSYERWITSKSWYTQSQQDKENFFNFVRLCIRRAPGLIDREEIRRDIVARHAGELPDIALESHADYFSSMVASLASKKMCLS